MKRQRTDCYEGEVNGSQGVFSSRGELSATTWRGMRLDARSCPRFGFGLESRLGTFPAAGSTPLLEVARGERSGLRPAVQFVWAILEFFDDAKPSAAGTAALPGVSGCSVRLGKNARIRNKEGRASCRPLGKVRRFRPCFAHNGGWKHAAPWGGPRQAQVVQFVLPNFRHSLRQAPRPLRPGLFSSFCSKMLHLAPESALPLAPYALPATLIGPPHV